VPALGYVVSGLVHRVASAGTFPYGTLFVNVLGCLLIGVLGGFTTFSTLAFETLKLTHAAAFAAALANIVVHVVLGLLAAWLGYAGAQQL
jgi:CrcB protein